MTDIQVVIIGCYILAAACRMKDDKFGFSIFIFVAAFLILISILNRAANLG